ncbi:hypothetical protein [Devosia geojensis]|uniref:hypothetical protein n=1 Tax=Devosia geojensis TaxID=443610 RepID=UPI000A8A0D3A|nr:hypothetical protein [Devosia geojensis]
MTTHRKTTLFGRVGDFLDVIGSAAAAAAAVENGRAPRARDLRVLGIDADQFRSIGKF